MGRRTRLASTRAALAVAGLVVWAGGFELGPALHVGLHDRLAEHDHGSGPHSHAEELPSGHRFDQVARWRARLETLLAPRARRAPTPRGTPVAHGTIASGHGAHALAHRDLAASAPAIDLPPVLPAPLVGLAPRPTAPFARPSRSAPQPSARGPPSRA